MIKKTVCALVMMAAVAASQLTAGVVMEMATKDSSGQEIEGSTILAQSDRIRIDEIGSEDGKTSMIFRGNDLVVIDHEKKSYYVIDEATLEQVSSQISQAMKQMEEQLANLPPEQRAMMEKMMKGRMQGMGMAGQDGAPPEPLRVEAGAASLWDRFTCKDYTVFRGAEKTQEICATPFHRIEGAEEMTAAFQKMAEFMESMTEAFNKGPFADMGETPLDLMQEIDGFPVHTRHFKDGVMDREDFLKSATQKSLDPAVFEVPKGYKKQDLMSGGR